MTDIWNEYNKHVYAKERVVLSDKELWAYPVIIAP